MPDLLWQDLLSECLHIVKILETDGHRAAARVDDANAPRWDAYPSSSLPESSIASGRMSDPTASAVEKFASRRFRVCELHGERHCPSCHGEDVSPACSACGDTWEAREDPIGTSVALMRAQAIDAANRIATAQEAVHRARGIGGQVFGVIDPDRAPPWATVIGSVKQGIQALIDGAAELPGRQFMDDGQKAASNRIEHELIDAKNRLHTAERAMRAALPTLIPDKARETCKGCGTARDVVTYFGQKPRQWIVSEASCRECAERPKRTAKGPQSKRRAS